MPIYEFVCEACGRLTEVMQKVSDPPPAACPECGGGRMAKLVSRTSFQLKGGGWYSDLYSSPKTKPEPGAKPAVAAAPASGGSASGGGSAPAAPAKAAPSGGGSGSSGGTGGT